MFHGVDGPLALIGNAPRDRGSIKTVIFATPYHHKLYHEREC